MTVKEGAGAVAKTRVSWQNGTVAGLVGAAAMGAAILAMNPGVIEVAIPALYGLAPPTNGAAGLVVHLSHGAVMGVAFAGAVDALGLDDATTVVGGGLVYGAVTWVVLAALLMPLWLSMVGFAGAPPFPNFAVPSLLWHLVYGGVLGAAAVTLE